MWLYGASGHGKVIKDIVEAQGKTVNGFIDDNPNIDELSGLPVVHSAKGADEIIVSIGLNAVRKKVVDGLECKFAGPSVHPSCTVSETAAIGEGTVVMANAAVNADTEVGRHCIINTGATVDHECQIGDFAHIAPGVHLCGQVHVGTGTLVGVGSSVIPCVRIGRWCVIGAGSVVVNDIPDGYLAYGNPCKLIKLVNEDMIKTIPNVIIRGSQVDF